MTWCPKDDGLERHYIFQFPTVSCSSFNTTTRKKLGGIMSKKGFTLVEIMIVVAIIALLAAIAIPNLLRAKISANDALAKGTLRSLSTASETFATTQSGNYPQEVTSLTSATPPFINENYCDRTISGYAYTCAFSSGSYTFTATPITVGTSGTTTWTITTGGVLKP
jgi:type IV pilus assembly protein PilA